MEKRVFVNLKTPIKGGHRDELLDKLKISIDYSASGVCFLDGCPYNGGVYIYLTPCSYKNGVIGTFINGEIHTMGYKILLKAMNRRSQKQIDLAAELILPYAEEIASYYSDKKHDAVIKLINKVYKSDK